MANEFKVPSAYVSTTACDDQLTVHPDDRIGEIEPPHGTGCPKETLDSFAQAARPLMKWLAENNLPLAKVIVDSNSAVLVEDSMSYRTDEFIVD